MEFGIRAPVKSASPRRWRAIRLLVCALVALWLAYWFGFAGELDTAVFRWRVVRNIPVGSSLDQVERSLAQHGKPYQVTWNNDVLLDDEQRHLSVHHGCVVATSFTSGFMDETLVQFVCDDNRLVHISIRIIRNFL